MSKGTYIEIALIALLIAAAAIYSGIQDMRNEKKILDGLHERWSGSESWTR